MIDPRVLFDEDRCKACELCISACPKGIIVMSDRLNRQGYHPATVIDQSRCTSCALCARMCPDMVITVMKPESRGESNGREGPG